MSNRTALIEHFESTGLDTETVKSLVDHLSDEQVTETLANVAAQDDEKTELRSRLMADPILRSAVAPATDWRDSDARFTVARTALRIIEATAAKHGLTATGIAQEMVNEEATMAQQIEEYGDPRTDSYVGGQAFYGFRCRVRDALSALKAEENKAKEKARMIAQDAAWEAQGLTRCDRCGGAGGHHGWPGFTCFDCGGHGAV